MPISSVNFGRWLERLGFKLAEQPTFHQSVQPVSVVGDHEFLVSPSLGPSGIFGCDIGAVALATPVVQIFGPAPCWIYPWIAGPQAAQCFVRIGQDLTTLPALNNPVVLAMQEFRTGTVITARRGEGGNVPSQDVPCFRIGAAQSTYGPRIFKPASGWIDFTVNAVNTALEVGFTYYELPNENAQ